MRNYLFIFILLISCKSQKFEQIETQVNRLNTCEAIKLLDTCYTNKFYFFENEKISIYRYLYKSENIFWLIYNKANCKNKYEKEWMYISENIINGQFVAFNPEDFETFSNYILKKLEECDCDYINYVPYSIGLKDTSYKYFLLE